MDEKSQKLLEDIKKLMILNLLSSGVQGKDIAQALGIDKSTLSRILPARKVKKPR